MKKCASCTKDLPDAALHCVFCGAKQAPAPAQAGLAKTVMGYSSNELLEQLKAQQAAQRPAGAPVPAPVMQPAPAPMPAPMPMPMPAPMPMPGPAAMPEPTPMAAATAHAASAPTMFVQNMGPPLNAQPQPQPPQNQHLGMQPTMMPQTMPAPYAPPAPVAPAPYVPAPSSNPAPIAPVGHAVAPAAPPPYLASQTAARAGRPIEPWKDTLRLVMFVFGGLLLAAFAVPLKTDPLVFNWDVIINGSGTDKLGPLLIAAVGLVSILIAAIPMTSAPRGVLAAIIGLAGGLVPMLAGGMPEWPVLSMLVGLIFLIPGLLVRSEYRDASLPRILVTVGAIGVLLPFLVPMHGEVGIVFLFQALIDAPGGMKVIVGLELAMLVIVVLSLLAWLPAPASGGAKLFAWLLIIWGAVVLLGGLLVSGHLGDVISGSPYTAVSWISGGGLGGKEAAMAIGFPCAYGALIGYGLATVFGKQLE